MKSKFKIAFLGQKKIAEECLKVLVEDFSEEIELGLIASNATDEVWWKSNLCFKLSEELSIPFIDNKSRENEKLRKTLSQEKFDLLISVQHPWILPKEVIEAVGSRAINFHNAKLPEYKGYNSCNHAILNQEETYTVTCHQLVPKVDEGNIIKTRSFPIDTKKETAKSLYEKANREARLLFSEVMTSFLDTGDLPKGEPMDQSKGKFYPRDSINGLHSLQEGLSEEDRSRITRALHFPPFPGAYYLVNGDKVYVNIDDHGN